MAISRIRLRDLQFSRFPTVLGLSPSDVASVARAANSAQERLLTCPEAGEHGWYGSYAEIAFNVSQTTPTIVLPRGVARLIAINACNYPVPINNQFYEYMQFGNGRWPKNQCSSISGVCQTGPHQAFRRSATCTFADLTTPGYGLRFTTSEAADAGRRILVGCIDAYGNKVFTLDGTVQVNGVYTTFATPFADQILPGTVLPMEISAITGIQKDVTLGTISVYQVELATGNQSLILQMEPGETVASYQVYYFNGLPNGCCPVAGTTGLVQITAMVKLDLVPCAVPTDYLLIQSKEALIAEAQSARFADTDNPGGKSQAIERHKQAVKYLQGQLVHYEGKDSPAISFAPFGYSRLERQRIGSLI